MAGVEGIENATDQAVADDFADIDSFWAAFDGSDTQKNAAAHQYAKDRVCDLEDAARNVNGYTSVTDALRARAFALRKRYSLGGSRS